MIYGSQLSYLLSIQEAISFLKLCGMADNIQVCDDIIDAISALKGVLPSNKSALTDEMTSILIQAKSTMELPEDLSEQFQAWCEKLNESLIGGGVSSQVKKQKKFDADFEELLMKLRHGSVTQLLVENCEHAASLMSSDKEYYDAMRRFYKIWRRIDDFTCDDKNYKGYFSYLYSFLKDNVEYISTFYNELCDYRSKYTLMCIIRNWLSFSPNLRYLGVERTFPHYYDLDLISCTDEEVLVDCGAFDGDSIESFINMYGENYKRIYAYELTPSTFQKLRENLEDYSNIVFRNVGVAGDNATIPMFEVDGNPAANCLAPGGNNMASVVSLDNDIDEDITFIKMDIEGAEPSALKGARKHIKRNHPKLAISLYHSPSHLLEIPMLIRQIDSSYKFYLRHTGDPNRDGAPFPVEYILIAI